MTIETEIKKVILEGNGVATSFSFSPIQIQDASHLEVTRTDALGDTVLAEGTGTADYVVVVSVYPGTGSITYPASGTDLLAADEFLTIKRSIPLLQEVDLENQGGYFPEVLEQALDRCVMQNLQQQEDISRAIKIPVTDASYPSEIPSAAERAGKYLQFDDDGNPTAVSSLDPDLVSVSVFGESLVGAANAAAAVGILSPSSVLTIDNATANAATETVADIAFTGRDSGASSTVYGRIRARVIDATDSTEDGDIRFNIPIAGTETPVFIIGSESTAQVYSGAADATANPDFQLYRESASPADADFGGVISFQMKNDGGDRVDYANIQVQMDDASDSTEDGSIQFYVMKAGTSTNVLEVDSVGVDVKSGVFRLAGTTYPYRESKVTTSGTSVSFTSIPTWATSITIAIMALSTNGTANTKILLGTGGTPLSSGYHGSYTEVGNAVATVSTALSTAFSIKETPSAAGLWTATYRLCKMTTNANFWTFTGSAASNAALSTITSGYLDVGGTLDIIRLSASGDTFDNGEMTIIVT